MRLVGIRYLEWTVKNHEADLMYTLLKKRDYPGYLYMIDNGATTTWEHWNGARSRIHNCYNGIGSWFYQALGGIVPDENFPGYRNFIIDPQIPEGVTWANTSKETPYGTVYVKWRIENGVFKMDVNIPGSTAMVAIQSSGKYSLDGKSYRTSDNMLRLSRKYFTAGMLTDIILLGLTGYTILLNPLTLSSLKNIFDNS
jgi:alpha-L-rhamnosidase